MGSRKIQDELQSMREKIAQAPFAAKEGHIPSVKILSKQLINERMSAKEIITVGPYYPGTSLIILDSHGIIRRIKTIGVRREFHNFHGSYEDHVTFDGLDPKSIRNIAEYD